jgi:hypothetical protein
LLLVTAGIVLGHLGCAFHKAIQRSPLDQSGPANLDTFDAAFPHHAAYVFNMVLELFGSLFCGDELVQIRHGSRRSEKG